MDRCGLLYAEQGRESRSSVLLPRACFLIRDNPGITFKEMVKAVKAKKALVAYHLAILKATELVTFTYERKDRSSSSYSPTELGNKVDRELTEAVK